MDEEIKSLIRFSIIMGVLCGFGIGVCFMAILNKIIEGGF